MIKKETIYDKKPKQENYLPSINSNLSVKSKSYKGTNNSKSSKNNP